MTKAKFYSAALMAVFVFVTAGAALLSLAPEASATCTGTDQTGADALAAAIRNAAPPPNPATDAATFTRQPACNESEAPHASSTAAESKFPAAGAGTNYAVLTNGLASSVDSASQDTEASTHLEGNLVSGGAFDVTTLTLDISPTGNCMVVDYKFFTEEYPSHVNDTFNDGFLIEMGTSNFTFNGTTGEVTAPNNIAVDEDADLLVAQKARLSKAAAVGTTYNAATAMLTAAVEVTPVEPIQVHFSIFDGGNNINDSAAFVDNLRFTQENPATCTSASKRRATDHGDLADPPYNTLTADADNTVDDGGARHTFSNATATQALRFSDDTDHTQADLDAETNGQPNDTATGDDAAGTDDEEDISVPALTAGETTSFSVSVASGNAAAGGPTTGYLHAFADWNGNGKFDLPGNERLTAPAGTTANPGADGIAASTAVALTVPADAAGGPTAFRFRITSIGGEMSPDGHAPDGEVQDYEINVTVLDWGDAPLPYPTQANASALLDGARHALGIVGGKQLGPAVDKDPNGQPTATANGDDNDGDAVDDEDGITNLSDPIMPGSNNSFTITTPTGGQLDAFVDFNQDEDWEDAGEKVLDNVTIASGTSTQTFTAPTAVTTGTTFARFRISTAGGLTARGKASDGEVEDYQATVRKADFGDLPAPYPTELDDNGPRHGITGLFLGADVDQDLDGLPHGDAQGDDTEIAPDPEPGDDEDGITIPTLATGEDASIGVSVTGTGGRLDGWIDFNDDGDLTDSGENVFSGVVVSPGANALTVSVPSDALAGSTFARFRLSSLGGLAPTGSAPDGEVEDYEVDVIGLDWADAPGTYATTKAQEGPRHPVASSNPLIMGPTVDTEPDGQPTADASGDDATGDDEDGVFLPPDGFVAGQSSTGLAVNSSGSGFVDIFLDVNKDGDFDLPTERMTPAAGQPVSAGTNPILFTVPADSDLGATVVRVRLSTAGGLGSGGAALDGEVEDYSVNIRGVDFGDAPTGGPAGPPPDSYPTLLANDGARHLQDGSATSLRLGANVDGDSDGQPTPNATGDDTNGSSDDEDGVAGFTATAGDENAALTVTANGGAAGARFLDAWADFNVDGDWNDPGEQIFTNEALIAGANPLTYAVPTTFPFGETATFYRFRVAAAIGDVTSPTGLAPNGEVEDYRVVITQECGRVLDVERTVHTVDRDLNCSGSAIIIGAAKVTVKLNGHTLSSDGTGAAVDNSAGHDVLKVLGPGTLHEFENGILSGDPGVNACIKCKYTGAKDGGDIVVTESTGDGILINGVKNTISGLTVSESGGNGALLSGESFKVTNSRFLSSALDGLHFEDPTNKGKISAKTLTLSSNEGEGAQFEPGTTGAISASTASDNGSFGAKADAGSLVKGKKMTYSGNNLLGVQCSPEEQMGCAP